MPIQGHTLTHKKAVLKTILHTSTYNRTLPVLGHFLGSLDFIGVRFGVKTRVKTGFDGRYM